MATDNKKFNQEYEKAKKVILKGTDNVMRGVAIEIFGEVIRQTPVGNTSIWKTKYPPKGYIGGRLRGNWQATIGRAASGEVSGTDANGGNTINKMVVVVSKFKTELKKSMYLTNNLPYARAIADGHSTQRPAGWIDTIVASFQAVVDKVAKEKKEDK